MILVAYTLWQASLSVAMGQRAPNRAAGREEGRGLGSSLRSSIPASAAASHKPREERCADIHAVTGGITSDIRTLLSAVSIVAPEAQARLVRWMLTDT